jgi:hypothetical protein
MTSNILFCEEKFWKQSCSPIQNCVLKTYCCVSGNIDLSARRNEFWLSRCEIFVSGKFTLKLVMHAKYYKTYLKNIYRDTGVHLLALALWALNWLYEAELEKLW